MSVGKSIERVVARPGVDGADAAMERYSKGDEVAFAELYDAIAPRLFGFLRKAMRDEVAAEDLMQQTLLQIHRERGSFIPGARVMPWAFAIARRLMIDSARRRRVEQRLFSDAPANDDRMTYEQAAAMAAADDLLHARRLEGRVQQRLDTLPEAQRTAYQLLRQEGLSLKEAAEVLGTSVTAVKLRAHRAYEALRAVLQWRNRAAKLFSVQELSQPVDLSREPKLSPHPSVISRRAAISPRSTQNRRTQRQRRIV